MRKTMLILLLAIPTAAFGDDVKPTDEQVLAWLRELEPLPKVHYSWPVPLEKLSVELLHEYVRLTQAVSVSGEWSTPEQIEPFYAAYRKLSALIDDPANQLVARLRSGDLLATHNHRVLHGRKAFVSGSGERRLQLSYMEYDDLLSRIRLLHNALAAENVNLIRRPVDSKPFSLVVHFCNVASGAVYRIDFCRRDNGSFALFRGGIGLAIIFS